MTEALFIHHSVGRHLIADGDLRGLLRAQPRTASVRLWDVDYAKFGARGPNGDPVELDFEIPDDNTDPDGLHRLITDPTVRDVRDAVLEFDLVVLKSCYPASHVPSDDVLRARVDLYSEMFEECGRLSNTFLFLTPPPLTRLRTTSAAARHAIELATRIVSAERPSNVHVLDLHRILRANDGRLAGSLSRPHRPRAPWDSHPNLTGRRAGARAVAAAIEAIVHRPSDGVPGVET